MAFAIATNGYPVIDDLTTFMNTTGYPVVSNIDPLPKGPITITTTGYPVLSSPTPPPP